MRILITGATGFIGSRLALHLRKIGMEVGAIGQNRDEVEARRVAELKHAGVQVHIVTLQDLVNQPELIPAQGLVVHLAAAQHESNMPESYFHQVNVEGTRTLLELSRVAGVRRFVYGSTIGVYGDGAGQATPLDEQSPACPANHYGRSKLAAEHIVASYADRMEVCTVRIAETYGPGDMRMLKLFRAIDSGRFAVIGNGTNLHQPIHVADLIEGLLAAAASPVATGETFVMAGTAPVTTRQMVDAVANAVGKPSPSLELPLLPFLAAAVAMETTMRPLGLSPPLHRRRLDFFRKSFSFSIAKAQQLLDFKPRHDFRSGAADAAQWYRSEGLLPAAS